MIRLYESPEIVDAYVKYRLVHPQTLTERVMKLCRSMAKHGNRKLDLMVDVGCGPGKSSWPFQPYFHKLIGIDISAEQLKQAKKQNVFDNVTFEEGSAENIPVEDGSVDLLIAGAAAYWFDLPKFYKEARRVLKPGGCIALWSYECSKIYPISCKGDNLALECEKLFRETLEKGQPDDPNEQRAFLSVSERYKDIFESIPFKNKRRHEGIENEVEYSLNDIRGLIRSVSCYETFMEKKIKEREKQNEIVTQDYLDSIDLAFAFTTDLKELLKIPDDLPDDEKYFKFCLGYCLLQATP